MSIRKTRLACIALTALIPLCCISLQSCKKKNAPSIQTLPARHKVKRGLGWDIETPFSSPKTPPLNHSFGHTGWTGGSIWIHPASESFLILLSNRNHPFERRSIRTLREMVGTAAGKALGIKD